ncbi:MAG: lytic murein transglycosylase [Bacteroidota bacterium]|nr:lytic murein transglycosylase [Candidatus Kapabacteria bacterium]MDW8219983.1 lytic murein transglycosylase [Bacteroidota bacterium]
MVFLFVELCTPRSTVASVRGIATVSIVIADTAAMTTNERLFLPVIEQLLAQGAEPQFIKILVNHTNTTLYEKLTKVNVPVKKLPHSTPRAQRKQYAYAYDATALRKSRDFLTVYDSLLSAAERRYNVPKEAIASILWVETRFGDFLGNYHVPSVYLSLALVTQPDYMQRNKERLKAEFEGSEEEWLEIERKLEEKSQRKAAWALSELLALQAMYKARAQNVLDLRGSWAGAFGLSQFIPSSYIKLAVDGNGDGNINLFDVHDAVHSIGNYLSNAGWNKSKRSQHRAVYNYNHSDAYVSAVLSLTKRLATQRVIAQYRKSS